MDRQTLEHINIVISRYSQHTKLSKDDRDFIITHSDVVIDEVIGFTSIRDVAIVIIKDLGEEQKKRMLMKIKSLLEKCEDLKSIVKSKAIFDAILAVKMLVVEMKDNELIQQLIKELVSIFSKLTGLERVVKIIEIIDLMISRYGEKSLTTGTISY